MHVTLSMYLYTRCNTCNMQRVSIHIQVVIKCAQSADRAHFAVVQLVAIMYNMLRPLFVPVCSVHNSNMQIHVT